MYFLMNVPMLPLNNVRSRYQNLRGESVLKALYASDIWDQKLIPNSHMITPAYQRSIGVLRYYTTEPLHSLEECRGSEKGAEAISRRIDSAS